MTDKKEAGCIAAHFLCKGVDLTFMQPPAEAEQTAAVSDTAADSVRISDL